MDRAEIIAGISVEMSRVETDFADLVQRASPAQLRRRSNGTRSSNQQLLFHMVFGYLVVRTLMPLVQLLGRLGWSRGFAATLNACRRPFHVINYLGSWGGGHLVPPARMVTLMRRTIAALQRRLVRETGQSLTLRMHFPTAWDPYFRPTMSVADVYRFGTEHYDHHRRQLTLQ